MSMQRRHWLAAAGAWSLGVQARVAEDWTQALRALEARSGGRLGVAVRDTGSGDQLLHRADELFPLCSTFKLLLAAYVLHRVEQGAEGLDRRVSYPSSVLVPHSPRTAPHAEGATPGGGMTVAQLCEATLVISDNAAANLLLGRHGGPQGLTAWLRSQGDTQTRLDRWETELNSALPGDPRDTTTPQAMLVTMDKLLLGSALNPTSRAQLQTWIRGNLTGDHALRAGFPASWVVGDKTGSGDMATRNDVAIVWPAGGRAPLLVASYLTGALGLSPAQRDGVHAEVARIASRWLLQR
jgi:beta-lactamase class A